MLICFGNIKIKEAIPIKTPADIPTFIPSNLRKKIHTSDFNNKCSSFITYNKIPFNTFDLEDACDSFDSFNS